MSTFLFDEIIFGPVQSRRLGISLGINLLPVNRKVCNFDCVYCECGTLKTTSEKSGLPERAEVKEALQTQLSFMQKHAQELDAITFAGNGEPTLHPEFAGIIDDTIEIRNKYFPKVRIVVLSNAILAAKSEIKTALLKIEQPVLKLDSLFNESFLTINQPTVKIDVETILANLKSFAGNFVLQTLFLKGEVNGKTIDNTTETELTEWLKIVKELHPKLVMIYTIARSTPYNTLEKIPFEKLQEIGKRVNVFGIETQITA